MPLTRLQTIKRAAAIAFALLALALPGGGAAQQQPDTPAPAEAQKPAPTPSEPQDPEAALQRVRQLGATDEKSTTPEAVAEFVQREERNFAELLRQYLGADADELSKKSVIELNNARSAAALGLTAVRERRRTLADSLARLSSARDQLKTLQDVSVKQLETERERAAPPALLERIALLIGEIDAARSALGTRSQALLELDNRLSALESQYGEVAGVLDEATRRARVHVFRLVDPPLWALIGPREGAQALSTADLSARWASMSQSVQRFWENYADRVVLHCVALALLLAAMLSLSASPAFRRLEAHSGSVRVLKRPVSSALVIMLFASPLIYPGLPAPINASLRVASLVPVGRLIPTFVPPAWRALFYLVTALFGLETLFLLFPEGTAFGRLALLLLSGAALWGVTRGVRAPLADPAFAEWRLAGLMRKLTALLALLLAVAIAANVIGATQLAFLLTVDIVVPAYFGIGLAAAVFAFEDFLRLLLHTKVAQGVRSIAVHRQTILARCVALTRWLAAGLWLMLALRMLGVGTVLYDALRGLLTASASLGTLEVSLGGILLFFFAVWIAALTARFVAFVLDNDVLPRMRLARGVPGTISTTARYLIIGLGLLVAASMVGIDLTKVALILGALSVGIGFGLQTVVNNFISGIILLFERPIQVGDTVQVGELLGVVRNIGIRASNVRTYGGAEVIVPNSELVSGQVINWTLSDRNRRLELDVGVAYGNRPADVIRVLAEVLEKHEGALKTPAPFVRFRGFGDSSLDFRVYVWVDYDEGLTQTSAILSAIYDALAEAGIEIPFPQRDLHLRSVSENAGRALRGEAR
jgi:potassium efflux system protein